MAGEEGNTKSYERLASVIGREEKEKIKSKGDLWGSQRLKKKIKTKEGLAAAFRSGRRKNVRVSFFFFGSSPPNYKKIGRAHV